MTKTQICLFVDNNSLVPATRMGRSRKLLQRTSSGATVFMRPCLVTVSKQHGEKVPPAPQGQQRTAEYSRECCPYDSSPACVWIQGAGGMGGGSRALPRRLWVVYMILVSFHPVLVGSLSASRFAAAEEKARIMQDTDRNTRLSDDTKHSHCAAKCMMHQEQRWN